MRNTWRKLLSVLLALSMIMSLTVTGWAADGTTGGRKLELEDLDPSTLNVPVLGQIDEEEGEDATLPYQLGDIVRVSIFLDKPATTDKYSTQNIAHNSSAMAYRQQLRDQQASVTAAIERATGRTLDVKWNLTLIANAISANVRYGDIAAIKMVPGVKDVTIERQYEMDKSADQPDTAITTDQMVGATAAWAAGYTGAGSRIAVIDTGLDYLHQSFDPEALMYALEEDAEKAGTTVDAYNLLTADEIASVASELNGKGVFVNDKVAYGYNYVDGNTTIDHMNDRQEEHGSHVSGIATANRYVKVDGEFVDAASTVFAVGVAPDAQIMVMKVFGAGGGAYDSDYMSAIEDAIVLNADSVNLSLGSGAPGWTFSGQYEDIMNSLVENGTVVTISAGNSGSWSDSLEGQNAIGYIYSQDISLHTGGSPGSFTNSLGVASADNIGQTGTPLIFNGDQVAFFSENLGYGNGPIAEIPGTYDYVYLDSVGYDEEWDAVGEFVSGKVALCNRGSTSFYQKANAAARNGAVAVVIVNNQPGVINMNLQGYTYTAPAVSITLADGQAVKAASASETVGGTTVYTGKVEVTAQMQTGVSMDRSEATISSFSSWGVPGSLIMKPEITAPGGDIYSVNGAHLNKDTGAVEAGDNATYESMSGTSMAAPQMAGMAAVLGQYIRENGLDKKWTDGNARHLINSLLMSTATPMIEADSGSYYPIMRQGAGLADVFAATQAKSFITMNEDATASYADGKVKVELGDNPERNPVYTYSFNITNMSEETQTYELSTDMFTQDVFAYGDWTYMDTWTVELPAEVTYEWGDFEFEEHDVDKNGVTNAADADAILKYLVGEITDEGLDLAAGDMDEDGKPSTYDAHLLLALLEEEIEERGDLAIPAGETATVKVTIQLTDTAMLDDEARNGAYVEGYTYVTSTGETEDGALMDVEHSIPILGFYGSWTDASMFDHNTALDAIYSDLEAYIPSNQGAAGLQLKYPDGKSAVFTGNPYLPEEEIPTERFAISSETTLTAYKYGLIRNSANTGFFINDAEGENLFKALATEVYGAWYYVNGATWQDTSLQNLRIGRTVSDLGIKEGEQLTTAMYAIPEYNAMQVNGGTAGVATEDEFLQIIDSGKLGEGASQILTFTVDDKAPEILSAEVSEDGTSVTVSAKDDHYIAFIGLMDINGEVIYVGEVPEQSAEGETIETTFELDPETMGNAAALFVGDYARNEAASLVRLSDGPIMKKVPVYMLTDTLLAGEEYVIADINTAGNANVLLSNGQNYYTSSTIAPVTSDDRGIYIPADAVDDAAVWVSGEGITLTNKADGGVLGHVSLNSPYASWANPANASKFTYADNLLTIFSGRYGMSYTGGYFMLVDSATPVYLYQKVDLEEEIDPDNASAVIVTPHATTLILGVQETVTLRASLQPIVLPDKTVTWTSSDESVATVDANGLVTAVAEGTTVVTATSNATPSMSDSCVVNVTTQTPLNATINGQVALGKDDIEFAQIDLNDMSVTNLAEDPGNNPFSAFVGGGRSGDYIYGADIDGDFHRYDATKDFAYDSDYHWTINKTYMPNDIANMPHFESYDADGNVVETYEYDFISFTANGWLAMFYDGDSASYFDLSGVANFVALCFAGINQADDGNLEYYYYAMDDTGFMYLFAISPDLEQGGLTLEYYEIGPVTVLSMGEDPTAYSMGYAGATDLGEGVFIADNNNQSMYFVPLTEVLDEYPATYVGKIDGASNLSALYDDLFDTASSFIENSKIVEGAPAGTVRMAAESVNLAGEKRSDSLIGGLNTVDPEAAAPVDRPNVVDTEPYGDDYTTVTLSDVTTNGLYQVTYNPEETQLLTAVAIDNSDESVLEHFFYVDNNGVVDLDFAEAEETDATIILLFTNPEDSTEMEVITKELGEDLDLNKEETVYIPGYLLTIEDLTNGKASFSIEKTMMVAPNSETTFTVTCDKACVVAVKNEDGTYTVLPCNDVDGEHTFTVAVAEADVTVVVALKGDANLDGEVNTKDATLVKQVYLGTGAFETDEALQNLTGDATGDGKITTKDSTLIKQVYLEMNTINW